MAKPIKHCINKIINIIDKNALMLLEVVEVALHKKAGYVVIDTKTLLSTEEKIEWCEDYLKFPFLYEVVIYESDVDLYLPEAIGIAIPKESRFAFARRIWTNKPHKERCHKVIPKSVKVGKTSEKPFL